MKKITLFLSFIIIVACSTAKQQPSLYERDANKMLERANKAFLKGDYANSIAYIDDAILAAKANNLPNVKIKALLQKSQLMFAVDRKNDAYYFIMEAKETASKEMLDYLPYVLYSEALYLWETKKLGEAIEVLKSIEKLPDDLEASYYNLLALLEMSGSKVEKVSEYLDKAEKGASREKNYEQLSYVNKLKAHLSYKSQKYSDAINFAKKALAIDRKTGNREAIAWDLEFLGTAYKQIGDKESAFYYYYQGYELTVAGNNRQKRDYFLEQAASLLK